MSINCAEEAAKTIHPSIPKRLIKNQECFVVLSLNAANEPLGKAQMVAMGTSNAVEVHPRDVFRNAIKRNAISIILAHNHPSGKTKPSADDCELTQRMKEAGKLLGIPVIDHLIFSPSGNFLSFADHGYL